MNMQSDSECSLDSTKVEIDSLCLEDDDFAPSMIQDFKYDESSNKSDDNFSDLNLNVISQKDDLMGLRSGIMDNLSRIRTSTKKEESSSLEAMCSNENSLAGSSQDLSDDATISDSESISKLRSSLNSKVILNFPISCLVFLSFFSFEDKLNLLLASKTFLKSSKLTSKINQKMPLFASTP